MGRLKLGLVILPLAGLAWLVVALVLGSGDFSGAHSIVGPSGPSPVCLPATLDHSAALPGTAVDVSPAPETDTASPYTQISFLGIPVTDIQDISVVGSQSGYHYGHLNGYFQGDGGSFVPYKPFDDGERVVVRAVLEGPDSGQQVGFSFRVDTPYPTGTIPEFPNPPAPASAYQSFVSLPESHPPHPGRDHARPRPQGGRHPHDRRTRPGAVRPAHLHPAGAPRLVRPALRRYRRREPQHPELRRPARPHLVAGSRALARLRPGRRHRDGQQLPDGCKGPRRQRPAGRSARLPARIRRRRLRHRLQPHSL